jgi:dTDP-4-amino-4,6-dideoxygalactose transaminase
VNDQIYLSSPDVGPAEEAAVVRAMRSGWIAPLGPEVDAFEKELARATGRDHAVALSSGTAALHLGLINMGARPGDVVITGTMTFAATPNAITYTGAEPVFVDSDADGNIDVELLGKAVEDQRAGGRRIAAVVPVDLFGKIADYEGIRPLVDRYEIPILADAAESLGATRNGLPAGSFGDAAALSFNGNKVMTTSGGGALLTDDGAFADRARYLSTQARQPVAHYEHTEVGYNYRMSNILAAIGRVQLQRLPAMVERRRTLRGRYAEFFSDVPGIRILGTGTTADHETRDNCWLTSILVDPVESRCNAGLLLQTLRSAGIEARPLWKPMHTQPVFAHCQAYLNGTSESLYERGLSLPSGSALRSDQIQRVLGCLTSALRS